MKKESILFGIIGFLLGCILSFVFTNNLNRNHLQAQTSVQPDANSAQNPLLPEGHPSLDDSGNPTTQGGAPLPQVQEALKAAQEQPNNFEVQMNAGDLYYQIQKFDESIKFYEQANKLRPGLIEVLTQLGNANFDSEKFEQAEEWYLKVLAKNPNNINVRTDLGLTFFLREPRNIERAIKEYQIALGKEPNHELTLQNLAIALREKGDTQGFQETIEKLRSVNPNNPILKNSP
jgi:tetratricopeptide (TPR) repeat protein